MLEIEPHELVGFNDYIEKTPTFSKYQSTTFGKEKCVEYGGDIYSITMFYQMGSIDVFTHDLSHGITGMSGTANRDTDYNRKRNKWEHKADVLADLLQQKVVKEASSKYYEDFKK